MSLFDFFKRKDEKKPVTREEMKSILQEALENPIEQKKYKMSSGEKKARKKSMKMKDMVLIEYLDFTKKARTFLTRLYGGTFIVVDNHVHRCNPSDFWREGKYNKYIYQAWNRDPVSTRNYDAIVAEGANKSTTDDPTLIKAIIQAKLSEKPVTTPKNWIIWVVFGVLGIAAAYLLFFNKH